MSSHLLYFWVTFYLSSRSFFARVMVMVVETKVLVEVLSLEEAAPLKLPRIKILQHFKTSTRFIKVMEAVEFPIYYGIMMAPQMQLHTCHSFIRIKHFCHRLSHRVISNLSWIPSSIHSKFIRITKWHLLINLVGATSKSKDISKIQI